MPIYTKKGDRGRTALFDPCCADPKSVSKNSPKITAIGALDELNSYLGIITSQSESPDLNSLLVTIQKDLFLVSSILAGANLRFSSSSTRRLEKEIASLEKKLPPLSHFILPGGSGISSHLHFARALARRAERAVVGLSLQEKIKPSILSYLNRLSDAFFIFARQANFAFGIKEIVWRSKNK